MKDAAPKPILMGRHLVDLGLEPGPRFGEILRQAFEAQLDGAFGSVQGGIEWLGQQGLA
jgi:tRNA nucleotidyltransferase (CCA-adding enzyme)